MNPLCAAASTVVPQAHAAAAVPVDWGQLRGVQVLDRLPRVQNGHPAAGVLHACSPAASSRK